MVAANMDCTPAMCQSLSKGLILIYSLEPLVRGTWVAQEVKHLPSAQVMISGSWDGALHQAPCSAGTLLLPLPLPLLVLSHTLINK